LAASNFGAVGVRFDSTLMRRITLRASTGSAFAMTLPQANAIFQIDDDISYTRPDLHGLSEAATQNASFLSTGASNSWGRRLSEGKISWIATLTPQLDFSGTPSDNYTLSIVMIYDRPISLDRLDNKLERIVKGYWQDPSAATGGEIKLVSVDEEQLKLRPNDWIMVSGSYMPSGSTQFISRFQWYRVAECDPEPAQNLTNAVGEQIEVYATLIGQDWNTNFLHPPGAGTVGGYPVRVTIVEGAFAVYEKTIRLEYGSAF
jgi:hypothetical protein